MRRIYRKETSETTGKNDGLALIGPAILNTKTQWAVSCVARELVLKLLPRPGVGPP